MVVYVSAQFALLTCFLITSSYGRRLEQAPTCAAGYSYEPESHVCVKTVSCGKNMAFKKTERPQVASETGDLCYNLGERGQCPEGQVLLPVSGDRVKCGVDACASQEPRNAAGLSTWSEAHGKSKSIFDFTYKGECYRTETRGFCREGHVVRFVVPSNTPTCVQVDTVAEGYITSYDPPPGGPGNTLRCGNGLKVNKARNDCVRLTDDDYVPYRSAAVSRRTKRDVGYITRYDPPPGGPGVTLRCGPGLKVNNARNDCVRLTDDDYVPYRSAAVSRRTKRDEGYITSYDPPPGGPGNTLRCGKGLKVNRSRTDCVPLTAADLLGSGSGSAAGPTSSQPKPKPQPNVGYITRYDPPPGGPGNTLRCSKGLKVNASLTDCVPLTAADRRG